MYSLIVIGSHGCVKIYWFHLIVFSVVILFLVWKIPTAIWDR